MYYLKKMMPYMLQVYVKGYTFDWNKLKTFLSLDGGIDDARSLNSLTGIPTRPAWRDGVIPTRTRWS
jgi:hypothetical protein